MKQKLVACLAVFSLLSINAQETDESSTQVRELEPFDKIEASNGINVKLYDNLLEEAEIKVKGVPLENVITVVEGTTLKVKMKVTIKSDVSVIVKVSYKTLVSLQATTGATIETARVLKTDKLHLLATTGGIIRAEVDAEEVDASSKAGSEINLFGETNKLKASGVLGGFVKAYKLISQYAEASSSGGSMVQIYAMEEADVKASLGGDIRVKGNPYEVKKKSSTGGDIRILTKPEHGKDLIRDE